MVQPVGLGNLLADREYRVQGGHRFLKYHRHPVAAHFPHGPIVEALQVGSGEPDMARAQPRRRWRQAQTSQRGQGFAATRFADQADGFAVV